MRRAISTTYYALFHCLAQCCADLFVGGSSADRSKHAWRQVYRALEHKPTKDRCKKNNYMKLFPKEIEDFGNLFVDMQIKRHKADYDPSERFYKSSVITDIDTAEEVIKNFNKAPIKDRRAFAAYVLFQIRGE